MNIYAYIDAVALMLLLLLFSVLLAAAALVNDILLRDSDFDDDVDDVTQIMQFFRHNFNSFSVLVINRMPIRIPCRL